MWRKILEVVKKILKFLLVLKVKNEKLKAMINKSIFLSFTLMFTSVVVGQTDAQLRDPEYLVEQYNQLVAKHNALIEKTRNLINLGSSTATKQC